MGFALLDNMGDENNRLSLTDDGKGCQSSMSATFLLKQDGKLYTATFSQTFSLPGIAGSGVQVEDLNAVAPKSAKPAAARSDDGDEQAQSAPASQDEQTSSPQPSASKLCVGTCLGPHIDLKDGKFKMSSQGSVGLKLN
jgi:hypothetical protein